MDISENYIKMCDCKEIQEKWDLKLVDICYDKIKKEAGPFHFQRTIWDKKHKKGFVWLPRQDQIQEMMKDWVDKGWSSTPSIYLVCGFARFCGFEDEEAEGRSNVSIRKGSMEQLWLAFYMYEIYNKTWEGETWDHC